MSKFHITEQGPAKCSATVRQCPYGAEGTEHFDALVDAEARFSEILGGSAPKSLRKRKTVDPGRMDKAILTPEDIREIMSSERRIPDHIGKPLMYGLIGSNLYGLDTPTSDQDIWILADGKGTGFYEMSKDSADVRIDAALNFIEKLSENNPETIDMLRSRSNSTIDSQYAAFFNNFRFNEYQYIDTIRKHAKHDFKNSVNPKVTEKRRAKHLKVALRETMLAMKVQKEGQFYDPKFSDREREVFYIVHQEIENERLSGSSSDKLRQTAYNRLGELSRDC